MMNLKNKLDTILPLFAALIVLASSMWRPSVTLAVSLAALILLSLFSFLKKNNSGM